MTETKNPIETLFADALRDALAAVLEKTAERVQPPDPGPLGMGITEAAGFLGVSETAMRELALALINQILVTSGHSVIPIPDEDWETLIMTAATIITALLAWWKNNSFTKAARLGDFHMRKARREAAEDKRINS